MRKKLQKGFTLVELIVVLILMGLITTAITMVLRPTTKLYVDVKNKTDEEVAAITLFDVLNGELRYATDVFVTSEVDDSTLPSNTLKHFIMLSNGLRPGDHLGAHGYAVHGLTANGLAGATSVGNSANLLGNTDIKFSIDGYSAESGKESITIGSVMHPMDNNGIMDSKTYKYSETFKLVNMQNRGQLRKTTIGHVAMVNYDSDAVNQGIESLLANNNNSTDGEQAIFIFYQRPDEAPSSISTSSILTNTKFQPFTATPGNKEIDLGASLHTYNIVIQPGTFGANDPKIVLPSTVKTPDSAGHAVSGERQVPVNTPVQLTIDDGTDDTIVFREGTVEKGTLKLSDFINAGTDTLYIKKDDTGNWTVDKEPAEDDSDNKDITLHYIRTVNDPFGALYFRLAEGVEEGAATVDGNTIPTSDSNPCRFATTGGTGMVDTVVHIAKKETTINVSGGSETAPIPNKFSIELSNNSSSDYYIYVSGDEFYYQTSASSLPEDIKKLTGPYWGKVHIKGLASLSRKDGSDNYIYQADNGKVSGSYSNAGYTTIPVDTDFELHFDLSVNNNTKPNLTFKYGSDLIVETSDGMLNADDKYYYVYNGTVYYNEDSANAAKQADIDAKAAEEEAAQKAKEEAMANGSIVAEVDSINNYGNSGQIHLKITNYGSVKSDPVTININMANPVNNFNNAWDPGFNGTKSASGNTATVGCNAIEPNQSTYIWVQFESNSFSVVSTEVVQ